MTITTAGSPTIIKAQRFLQPEADAQPLQQILENANSAYRLHRPPLLQCLFTTGDNIDRQCTIQIPINPSADDLRYTFKHYLLPQTSSPNDDMTIKVEEWSAAGGWSTIYGPATISATDGTRTSHKASGFVPFDDGLLTSSGAGLNVEHHNRPKRNAHALLADRKQCAFSFVQEDDPSLVSHDIATPGLDASVLLRIAQGRVVVPGQSAPLLRVRCIASVSAGSTSDRVYVRQVNGAQVELDANGTSAAPTEATIRLDLAQPGTLAASALLQALGQRTAGNSLYIHAIVAWWEVGS